MWIVKTAVRTFHETTWCEHISKIEDLFWISLVQTRAYGSASMDVSTGNPATVLIIFVPPKEKFLLGEML